MFVSESNKSLESDVNPTLKLTKLPWEFSPSLFSLHKSAHQQSTVLRF